MRKRNIQKIVRFNRKEAQNLAAKAKKACLSEAGLTIYEKPDMHGECPHIRHQDDLENMNGFAYSQKNLSTFLKVILRVVGLPNSSKSVQRITVSLM